MQTVLYLIQGQVQGVGYRQFTRRTAIELNVAGWVRNLPDGSVECLAQASAETQKVFCERLKKGPERSRVDQVDEQPALFQENLSSFTIEHFEG